VFACSGLFQGMGNTWPGMASTATRLVTFILPAIWLSHQAGFALRQLWFLSVATVLLQAVVSGLLVRWQMRQRLAASTRWRARGRCRPRPEATRESASGASSSALSGAAGDLV
jgi:uncharacterized membrane protein